MTPHELDANVRAQHRQMVQGLTDELKALHREAYERAKERARKPQETADGLTQLSKMVRGLNDELKALFPIIKKEK